MAAEIPEQKNDDKKKNAKKKDPAQNAQYGRLILARQLKELQKNSVQISFVIFV